MPTQQHANVPMGYKHVTSLHWACGLVCVLLWFACARAVAHNSHWTVTYFLKAARRRAVHGYGEDLSAYGFGGLCWRVCILQRL